MIIMMSLAWYLVLSVLCICGTKGEAFQQSSFRGGSSSHQQRPTDVTSNTRRHTWELPLPSPSSLSSVNRNKPYVLELAEAKISEIEADSKESSANVSSVAATEISDGGGSSSREKVVKLAVGSFSAVAIAAKTGLIAGDAYTDAMIFSDIGTGILTAVLGYVFVKANTLLAKAGILEPKVTRKTIHTFSAPLYMIFWPLYSDYGRFFAACVPLINALRLYLAGNGEEEELGAAVSRSGEVKEAIEGPFVYVVILAISILLFWRESSMVSIIPLCAMAGGDGPADLIGRKFGKTNKWFFSPEKSVAGTMAFFTGATLFSLGIAAWWNFVGLSASGLPPVTGSVAAQVAAITGVCALVELLPNLDDNYSVPLTAAVLSAVVFLQQ